MPVHVCPRCHRTNPEAAVFCYHDGALLQAGSAGNGKTTTGEFNREFVFPSGRRCTNFDEFSQGCQEEWPAARDLLQEGIFKQFFSIMGRADLVRASQEAMEHVDGDMGLSNFLGALPASRVLQPRMDIHPRRLELGKLTVGDTRRVQFAVSNTGQGQLQGTIKIAEGGEWLSFANEAKSCGISLAPKKEQKFTLEVNTKALVALQTYGGKLVAITNGGVVEVPLRLDVAARPFTNSGFPEVKTPREMAEQMRVNSKAAVPLLESGEVLRWFASNNWNYPVQGQPIKGLAGVQQFFEAMGLSKPPPLHLSQSEFRFRCDSPDPIRFQIMLGTPARKWVYALVESDQPWLRILTPQVGGPQKAAISFEVNAGAILSAPISEAKVTILANAGQKLPVRVVVESTHPSAVPTRSGIVPARPDAPREKIIVRERVTAVTARPAPRSAPSAPAIAPSAPASGTSALLAMAMMFLLIRLCLIPVSDLWARAAAVRSAAAGVNQKVGPGSPLLQVGGWLRLPWNRVLLGSGSMPATAIDSGNEGVVDLGEFRHYFVKNFIRDIILALWWVGPVVGGVLLARRGDGVRDIYWGVLAGAAAGVIGSATLACVFLLIETIPHALWSLALAGKGDPMLLFGWLALALLCWSGAGAIVGLVFGLIAPLRRGVIVPVQGLLTWLLGWCGMAWFAKLWAREELATPRSAA